MAENVPARSTLQDRVYAELSADIARGVLGSGERLRVAHLAKRFGTSQAPVREALRRLTEEGLAVTEPYVGSVVREPSWSEIQDIYAVRAELETYAIRRIFVRRPPASMAPLQRALREMERAVRAGDELQVIEADLAFHRQVCDLSGSPLTLEIWESITQRARGARVAFMRQRLDRLDTVVPSHALLVDALTAGDSAHTEDLFRGHLADAIEDFAQITGLTIDQQALAGTRVGSSEGALSERKRVSAPKAAKVSAR
jgi:DNA-binding GntR family transcriptional regulator